MLNQDLEKILRRFAALETNEIEITFEGEKEEKTSVSFHLFSKELMRVEAKKYLTHI
ncbi:hypothetical protein Q8G35_19605 [Peribacillus simplex]|uniref:Uncharacterized protein n=2 Tax=Peribacillus TaxID=2675229 RepID=A0AA90PCI6_9BACI|nr:MULTISPECIES: hypothetical protein [Peribacillus]MDP1420526.1 hypothetical protein [Peribacillus simplex]MDP1453349.1 hypothetical protein [Peribacillus frigoritolerans]